MIDQLELFPKSKITQQKLSRSGTFVDNMKLPIHRWFRYSAGFAAEWVEEIIQNSGYEAPVVLDPFAGSGTVLISADKLQVVSIGIEAHSFVARIAKAKTFWSSSVSEFKEKAYEVLEYAKNYNTFDEHYPDLINRSFSSSSLLDLSKLKKAWQVCNDKSCASELVWLAITAILRSTSSVNTSQWQYILPNKSKKNSVSPFEAFHKQIKIMIFDMELLQNQSSYSQAKIFYSDARTCNEVVDEKVDLVITSPPYANNYDYADSTRFEMSFWGEVQSWGDLHQAVRKNLIVSSSQHASREKLSLEYLLEAQEIQPIYKELSQVCQKLASERLNHGGKKHYHTMVAAYFLDMAKVWLSLQKVCKENSQICFVVGDSAPYGIHVPVNRWLGELAVSAGFEFYTFDKLRDRNVKWKNRKHRFPLQEGILWVSKYSDSLVMASENREPSSSGHKLGQLIGDWFEEFFVLPLLTQVSEKLDLFLDNRFVERPVINEHRGEKIIWNDEDGNSVDFDFVLELGGSNLNRGIPVAFVECFWRRGARHSKDKARDDSGKLTPMRISYPTARFLGIISAGDFTAPARELVRSRDIDLFYVPKEKIVQSFRLNGLHMDYPDRLSEGEKRQLSQAFEADLTLEKCTEVSNTLIELIGQATVDSYVDRVRARLSSLPQEIRIILRPESEPLTFRSVKEASDFIVKPSFQMNNPTESYMYQITYSDGSEFEQDAHSLSSLRELHQQVEMLSEHMSQL
ncbi:MAG: DNA methyltransferase [Thainema sp.]